MSNETKEHAPSILGGQQTTEIVTEEQSKNALPAIRDYSHLSQAVREESEKLDLGWRQATALSRSQLIPERFQGKPADCFILAELAVTIGCTALTVLQNAFVVKGTPGWSSSFAIFLANGCGAFKGKIKFATTGAIADKTLSVTARATLADDGDEVSSTVDLAMAERAGWTVNVKYKEIPEQMLSYRAATFLIRLYAPEALHGMRPVDEIEDVHASEPRVRKQKERESHSEKIDLGEGKLTVDVQTEIPIAVKPKPEPKAPPKNRPKPRPPLGDPDDPTPAQVSDVKFDLS